MAKKINDILYKQGDPWITKERNKHVGSLCKVVHTPTNVFWRSEPAWFIGISEGGPPNVYIYCGTIGLLIKRVRDRWIVLIGEKIYHMHENSLTLLEKEDCEFK